MQSQNSETYGYSKIPIGILLRVQVIVLRLISEGDVAPARGGARVAT